MYKKISVILIVLSLILSGCGGDGNLARDKNLQDKNPINKVNCTLMQNCK